MRIVSANVNGIRSAAKKGFFDWMTERSGADIVCIQETKAQLHQLDDTVFQPEGWHRYFFDAQRPGYSGTAIYSQQPADRISTGLGFELCDSEGRWLEASWGDLTVVSLYLPSGSASDAAQARKDVFLVELMPILRERAERGEQLIICGDWNIAHREIDLKNWKGNLKNSGFLPHERAWLTELFDQAGYVDAFRVLDDRPERYTWWSNRGQAYANNVGWRIDYQIITENLRSHLLSTDIYRDEKFSDHAPLWMDYTL